MTLPLPESLPAGLTAFQVEREFGIPPTHLRTWTLEGCPGLDRRKPRVQVIDGIEHFDRKQMKKASQFQPPSPEYRDERGRHYVSRKEAARRYPFSSDAIAYWMRKPCVWLDRRPLRIRPVLTYDPQPRGGYQRIHYILVDDLETVRIAQTRMNGSGWVGVRRREAERLLGMGLKGLTRAVTLPQPALDGRPVRYERAPFRFASGQVRNVNYYSKDDLSAVRDWRRTKCCPGELQGMTADEAAKLLSVDASSLHLWRRNGCRHLPTGRRLRAEPLFYERSPQRGVDRVWQFDAKDIETIATSLHSRFIEVFEDSAGRWLSAREAARRFSGLRPARLAKWRRKNRCPFMQGPFSRICRKFPVTGGLGSPKKGYVWGYFEPQLTAIFGATPSATPRPSFEPGAPTAIGTHQHTRFDANPAKASTESASKMGAATQARGEWLYEMASRRPEVPYKEILRELNRIASQKGWEPLGEEPTVHRALKRWCQANRRPMPVRNRRSTHKRTENDHGP
jgi:hypothetical protein